MEKKWVNMAEKSVPGKELNVEFLMMLKWWQKIWVNFAIFLSYLLLTTPSLNSLLAAVQWVFSLSIGQCL
jgi:hypothetical protein